jgi:hypothetical protein
MRKIRLICISVLAFLLAVLAQAPGTALARGLPLSSWALTVGPYAVDLNLYSKPLRVAIPIDLTVVPHGLSAKLTGEVVVNPEPGTDASSKNTALTPGLADTDLPGTLAAEITFPVQGDWELLLKLSGPAGQGEAAVRVAVLGPGAIPLWLAWLIGIWPIAGIIWFSWRQRHYRKMLIAYHNSRGSQRSELSQATCYTFHGTSHATWFRQSDAFQQLVLNFLQKQRAHVSGNR